MRRSPLLLRDNKVPKQTGIGRKTLELIFHENVVELTFKRRIKPPWHIKDRKRGHMKFDRHMLCTANWRMISSPRVRKYFKWKRPKHRRGVTWYRKRKLLIVWDIMMNAFRCISLDAYMVCGFVPVAKLMQRKEFVVWYRRNIHYMPKYRKLDFSDK